MQLGETAQFQVRRINEISLMARTTWFGLLAYLAFVGVTLLAVEDADFFVPARQTRLPVVGVDIPTASFFWFAPILGAALYAYLHLQLIKLWDALADADPRPGHRPLASFVYPWLINDLALSFRPGAGRALPLRLLAAAVTGLLVWAAGPVVLFGFWYRSWPAHDELLTHLNGLCLLTALYVGFASAWWLRRRLSGHRDPAALWRGFWVRVGALTVILAIAVTGDLRSQAWSGYDQWLARANLAGVELIPKPANWRDYPTQRQRFRRAWCQGRGLGPEICGRIYTADDPAPAHRAALQTTWCADRGMQRAACSTHFAGLEVAFKAAWAEEWAATLSALGRLDLSGRDLRGADLSGAFLANVDLEAARLEGANLREARMEGADLFGAWMDGAILSGVRMEGALLRVARMERVVLRGARMEGANLSGARMEGASLSRARMAGADLSGARMDGANLRGAWMEGADLSGAWMVGVFLRGARMEGANLSVAQMTGSDCTAALFPAATVRSGDLTCRNLTQAALQYTVGDEDTRLAPGLHVWSCLDRSILSGPAVDRIEASLARWTAEPRRNITRADFERALFCDPDDPNLLRRDQYPIPVLPGRPH